MSVFITNIIFFLVGCVAVCQGQNNKNRVNELQRYTYRFSKKAVKTENTNKQIMYTIIMG